MKTIHVFTDGSCLGNPGVMGYAAILQCDGKERICCGHATKGTNNLSELRAVVLALAWVDRVQKEQCEIVFHTDSATTIAAAKHSDYSLMAPERKNNDAWTEYVTLKNKYGHVIKWVKVQGHANCPQNLKADKLARAEAVKARYELYGGK
jgi:ribonuclease HI